MQKCVQFGASVFGISVTKFGFRIKRVFFGHAKNLYDWEFQLEKCVNKKWDFGEIIDCLKIFIKPDFINTQKFRKIPFTKIK